MGDDSGIIPLTQGMADGNQGTISRLGGGVRELSCQTARPLVVVCGRNKGGDSVTTEEFKKTMTFA